MLKLNTGVETKQRRQQRPPNTLSFNRTHNFSFVVLVVAVLFDELVKSSSTKDIDKQSIFDLAKKYGYKMDKS